MDKKERKRAEKRLSELYAKIPSFKCVDGCTKCCGPVPWQSAEIERVRGMPNIAEIIQVNAHTATPFHADACLDCPFARNGGCDVYADRPFICRLYGTSEDLPCPAGGTPERLLSHRQTEDLMRANRELIERHPFLDKGTRVMKVAPHPITGGSMAVQIGEL